MAPVRGHFAGGCAGRDCLQLRDPLAGRGQFGLLVRGDTRHLLGVDQMLAAPDTDGLLADVEELREGKTRREVISCLKRCVAREISAKFSVLRVADASPPRCITVWLRSGMVPP